MEDLSNIANTWWLLQLVNKFLKLMIYTLTASGEDFKLIFNQVGSRKR